MVEVENLRRNFGNIEAVKDISFSIKEGEIFGLLGPNGAGKSTTIKMLVTLLKSTSGTARINGFDITKDDKKVRKSVGIIFQDPSLDERLTAQENLYFHAKFYHILSKQISERIQKALELVDLTSRKNDLVMNFSGGMKRRLEIARGVLHTPRVLFLDEPTIGLDPQTRKHIWQYLDGLRKESGLTMLLTTHYMEEAEICDRIAIIDHGEIIALDTPENLKKNLRKDSLILKSDEPEKLSALIKKQFRLESQLENNELRLSVEDGKTFLPLLFQKLGEYITSVDIKKPGLEEVFIQLTGRKIREEEASDRDKLRTTVKTRGRK